MSLAYLGICKSNLCCNVASDAASLLLVLTYPHTSSGQQAPLHCPPLKPTSPHPQPSYVHMPSLRGYIWHVPFSSCWCMSLHSQTCHHCVQKLHDNKTKGCNCLHPEGVCHCTQRQYVIGRRGCMSLPLVGRPCIHRVVCHYIQRLWLSKAVHHCSQGFHVIASKD